jgi:hypothetical protein
MYKQSAFLFPCISFCALADGNRTWNGGKGGTYFCTGILLQITIVTENRPHVLPQNTHLLTYLHAYSIHMKSNLRHSNGEDKATDQLPRAACFSCASDHFSEIQCPVYTHCNCVHS